MNLNFKLLGYKLKKGKTKPINISFSHEPGFNDVITINLQFLKDQKHVEERLFRKLYGGKQERLEEVIEEIEDFSKEITKIHSIILQKKQENQLSQIESMKKFLKQRVSREFIKAMQYGISKQEMIRLWDETKTESVLKS